MAMQSYTDITQQLSPPSEQVIETPEQERDRLLREAFQRWAESFLDDAQTVFTDGMLTASVLVSFFLVIGSGGLVMRQFMDDQIAAGGVAVLVGGLIWLLLGRPER